LKDRHAVTRQWVSVPESAEGLLNQLDGDGILLIQVSKHANKLKAGHLRGNRFRILVRDVNPAATERLELLLAYLKANGLPNYYGRQRFGHQGETLRLGLAMLRRQLPPESAAGRKPNLRSPFLRKLALSAAQSALFNHYLALRLADGLFRRVLFGDVMAKWPFGGMFVAEDVVCEQERFDRRETVTAGPIFGRKTFAARGEAAAREAAALADFQLTPAAFAGFGKLLQGTRRQNLVYVDDLGAAAESDGVRLTFTLPAGSYATQLLREVTKIAAVEADEDSGGRKDQF
jgi:tRNA pseudouridine13 synthase